MADIAADLALQVREHAAAARQVRIAGGNSKWFLGEAMPEGLRVIDVKSHDGVMSYEPKELVVRARAGTPVAELRELLASEGQMLGFEPADLGGAATLGGTVAAGISGPRRPWSGAVRDFVLGAGLITGKGEHLEFGGQVMKNVAGFDVSRLLAGSMGTLGIITDVSLKVLPAPQLEMTLVQELDARTAHRAMLALSNQSLPVSALCHLGGRLYIRFSGSEAGVRVAARKTGGEPAKVDIWRDAANFSLGELPAAKRLWRVSVPRTSPALLAESRVIEWGGALRWLADPEGNPRNGLGEGHATLFRAPDGETTPRFQPLTGVVAKLHHELKKTFDPAAIMNPGRMYRDL